MLLEKEGVVIDLCQNFKKEGTLVDHEPSNYDLATRAQLSK
jgi:hypothetical protein